MGAEQHSVGVWATREALIEKLKREWELPFQCPSCEGKVEVYWEIIDEMGGNIIVVPQTFICVNECFKRNPDLYLEAIKNRPRLARRRDKTSDT